MKPRSRPHRTSRKKTPSQSPDKRWVEQTLGKMTLREKLGQMLMVAFFGGFTPAESADYASLSEQIKTHHVGGLILGTARGPMGIRRSQVYPTAVLLNDLQRQAKIPLLVGADFESGTRMRLEEGTPFPSAMAIAATREPKFAYTAGKITAIEARAAGVHWVFAPDADLNNNPANPIINVRSFGEDPKEVSAYVTQFIRGVEENGALATAKHFPGHGNVTVDSHLSLATVTGNRRELEAVELVPFRAAFRAGVSSIMPGHLAVPALDPDPQVPATLSRAILTDLLRREMKFQGLIVTDALEMGGVTSLYAPGEAAVRAVEAGADVLLMPPVPDAALAGLEAAVADGRIPARRIEESVRRILAAKARLGIHRNRLVEIGRLSETFSRPEYAAQSQEIADRSVTLLRDSTRLLPLDLTRRLRVLLVALSADPDALPGEALEADIRSRVDSLTVLRADTRFTSAASLKVPPPDSYDVSIAAIFVRVADRKGNVGFPEDQRAIVNQLLVSGKPLVVASFGSPYLIERFPTARTWVGEFSTNDVSQRAVARALFGQIPIGGKIPVTVPGNAERGAGLRVPANPMTLAPAGGPFVDRLRPVYDLLGRAMSDGAFPGGVLAVGWNDELAMHPFGRLSSDAKSPRVTPGTIYDVASLTKPIVTTTAVMMLVQQSQLDLDAPVTRYLPEFAAAAAFDPDPAWRKRIAIRMLLLHNSGLPAHRDFFKDAKSKAAMLARVMDEPLVRELGKQIEYSDLGFILLGEIIERLTGRTLDTFAREHIFAPLAMDHSMFNPPRSMQANIAPTENDTTYRKRLVRGEVHDENAWAMGGVAGHTGLFSTAGDIAVFAQMILNGGIYAHRRLLSRATIAQFTARQIIGDSAVALGWDVPTEPSSSGQYFPRQSYGHLGFTGTSLWIDPSRRLFVILLTNRINPTRANDKIRQVRPALHDAVVDALGVAGGQMAAR